MWFTTAALVRLALHPKSHRHHLTVVHGVLLTRLAARKNLRAAALLLQATHPKGWMSEVSFTKNLVTKDEFSGLFCVFITNDLLPEITNPGTT